MVFVADLVNRLGRRGSFRSSEARSLFSRASGSQLSAFSESYDDSSLLLQTGSEVELVGNGIDFTFQQVGVAGPSLPCSLRAWDRPA